MGLAVGTRGLKFFAHVPPDACLHREHCCIIRLPLAVFHRCYRYYVTVIIIILEKFMTNLMATHARVRNETARREVSSRVSFRSHVCVGEYIRIPCSFDSYRDFVAIFV